MLKKYLILPALPYANGPIHLGHLLEHIPINIIYNSFNMYNRNTLYICASDSHGTPIEMKAKENMQDPCLYIERHRKSHELSFNQFGITFNGGYQSTHQKDNIVNIYRIFNILEKNGDIFKNFTQLFFDNVKKRFLSDRFVKGQCPFCKADDQNSDSCEKCGSTYDSTTLIKPISIISKSTPILKFSKDYFLDLKKNSKNLQRWISNNSIINKDIKKYVEFWFKVGLKPWCISRNKPYFGIKFPNNKAKYFYVWIDAPLCYIGITNLKKMNVKYSDYWKNYNAYIIHIIGKDIIYFHTLFWPSILIGIKYKLPNKILVHGMLTINGQKLSKSKNNFITAQKFGEIINPEILRYYFGSKFGNNISDINFSASDIVNKTNGNLINNSINLLSRTIALINKFYSNSLMNIKKHEIKNFNDICFLSKKSISMYIKCNIAEAISCALQISSIGNQYFQSTSPWNTIKTNKYKAHEDICRSLWIGKVGFLLLKPVIPNMTKQLESLLNINIMKFTNIFDNFSQNQKVNQYEAISKRIDLVDINKIFSRI